VLPVGSSRRASAVRLARNAGVLPVAKPSEYQRWISTVEPWLFSSATHAELAAVAAVSFHIEVCLDSATASDVERTFLSLGNQTHSNWTAHVFGRSQRPDATAARLREGEPRIVADPLRLSENGFVVSIDAGDTFAPQALFEAARVVNESVVVITADHDSLNQFGDQRTNPRRHVGADPDALRQYDPLQGFVARRSTLANSQVLSLLLTTPSANSYVHVPHLLLHRRHHPGPIQRVLPGTDIRCVQSAASRGSLVHPGASDLGTQVRERNYGTEPIRVGVVVTGPLAAAQGVRQRADLLARINEANVMFTSMNAQVSVVLCDQTLSAFPAGADVARLLESANANVGFVIDGALRVQSTHIFADLVGVALRPNVFAVAPIVVAPSGVAIDAGLEVESVESNGDQSFVARCGPLRRPPYSLLWTRAVGALSGRCLLARTESFRLLENHTVEASNLSRGALSAASGVSSNANLIIWPHHQVVATYAAMGDDGNTPAALVWRAPRLVTWFGPNIAAYSPLNDSASESVW
jgi:hypothetical protein